MPDFPTILNELGPLPKKQEPVEEKPTVADAPPVAPLPDPVEPPEATAPDTPQPEAAQPEPAPPKPPVVPEGPAGPSEKEQTIATAALAVFARYGFKRATMEDIATEADISRPTIYQYFKNKNAIFRSLIEWNYHDTEREVAALFAQDLPPVEALERAFRVQTRMVADVLDTPHGAELMDTGHRQFGEVLAQGEARMVKLYAEWLTRLTIQGAIRLPGRADDSAETILLALHGLKKPPVARYDARQTALAHMIMEGLKR